MTPPRFRIVNLDCENPSYAYEEARYRALGATFDLHPVRPEGKPLPRFEAEVAQECQDADIIIIERSDKPVSARILDSLSRCRGIVYYCVGFEGIDLRAASDRGIVVANAADYCTEEVSDHAVALLLGCARQIMIMDRGVRAGGWQVFPSAQRLRRIRHLTLGLFGFGRIAQGVAKKMAGFGVRILAADPYLKELPSHSGVELVAPERLFRESDLLSIHVPLSPETRGVIGAKELALMKPTALLVNTSRGGVIDEKALIQALAEDRIAGAGLDVMVEEPLPLDSPLRAFDQVILTPHYGSGSADAVTHLQRTVADSVEAILRGYWPPFPLNVRHLPQVALRPWHDFRTIAKD